MSLAIVGQPSADAALIPSIPGPLFVPKYAGAPAVANPIASFAVPQNPFMSPNPTNSIHDDAYATDSYPGSGPLGRKPIVQSAFYGVDECATMTFDALHRLVGLCVQSTGPVLQIMNPVTLGIVGKYKLPPRQLSTKNPLTDLCGGAYFYLDNHNRVVVATTQRSIQVVGEGFNSFTLQHTYDLTSAIGDKDCLIALMPAWNGLIWFVSSQGVVGNVNPNTDVVRSITLPGEIIDNSFATDETGGVFIASDHAMYRFDAAPDGTPVVTWRQTYDRGSVQKPGQLAQGTGTTPTLVGTDYVAITDNADPRMNVLVYRRSAASGGALVCGAPVFAAGQSDTENSLVALRQTTEQEKLQANAVRMAERAYAISEAQLRAGTIDIVTLLNTQQTLFSARTTLAQARLARLQAAVGLFRALGGGWGTPV